MCDADGEQVLVCLGLEGGGFVRGNGILFLLL